MLRHGLLVALILLLIPSFAFAGDGEWESMGEIDGVKVWKKQVPDSDLFAFRGEVVADVHIGKIMSIFVDGSERKNWVSRYDGHKTLKKGDGFEEYWIAFDTPFPVTNRDYVLRSEGKSDVATGVFTCNIKSIERSAAPENDCCVRAQANGTFYKFTAVKGATPRTKMIVEVHTDPKGMLPDWLVNMIQKKWPSETLNGLIARAKRAETPVHPNFASWHDQKMASAE